MTLDVSDKAMHLIKTLSDLKKDTPAGAFAAINENGSSDTLSEFRECVEELKQAGYNIMMSNREPGWNTISIKF